MMASNAAKVKLPDEAVGDRHPLLVKSSEFAQSFNRKPFMFRHELAGSPLFSMQRLTRVAEKILESGDPRNVTTRVGKSTISEAKFGAMPLKKRLAETVARIADANVWLKLSSAQLVDAEYDEVLRGILREVEEQWGRPLLQDITWSAMTIFLASPRILTPYHIDHESNFLLQVRGSKQVNLFDPLDRELVPLREIENFYAGDFEAAQYRPDLQVRANVFELEPGKAVHHPPLAPHWVQNGDDVSISVSIGFCLRPLDHQARVYQVNHFLRRMGLDPKPPGQSLLIDGIKKAGIGLVSKSNPTTPGEILFSGLTRIATPPRAVKRWVRALRGVTTQPA